MLLRMLCHHDYTLQASIRKDVRCLSLEMRMIHDALCKVAKVPHDQLKEDVKLWAREARHLSYNMELVVDSCLLSLTSSQLSKGLINKMGNFFKKGMTCHEIVAAAIKGLMLLAEEFAGPPISYSIDKVLACPAAMTSIDPRLTDLYAKGGDLVGIDGKQDQELIKLLSEGDNASNKKLKMVCVVGIGGLGKTTLVKAVYDKIKEDFDCDAFVTVGRNASAREVFMDMISQLTMNNSYSNTSTLDEWQLIYKLEEILENKRYLIVIDDIWDTSLWSVIDRAFSRSNNLGSRIVTTTLIVSLSIERCFFTNGSVYHMEPLSDDDSKSLLYDRIFGSVSRCSHEFEQVSSDILKKCGGVPLAITAMASVLAGDPWMKSKDEWHALLKSIGHAHIEGSSWKEMQRIVSYSYYDLPSYLKTCLLYLSTFPVGHPIDRERFVKKWIMDSMIYFDSQDLSLEETASMCLRELIHRNVIHPLERNNKSEVISYHIHHVMHDVLKIIAIEEKFAASLDDKDILSAHLKNFPYLSIYCPDSENLIGLSSMAFDCGVRSLTVFGHANRFLLGHFEGIRHLDLQGCKSLEREDVEYICSMVLLKQLCLAKTDITDLPPEIDNLQYLEGLDIEGTQITELPPQIGNLQYLKRLCVGGTQITQLQPQILRLQRLKTLDARKSRVKVLPDQVVRLTGLVNLLIGDSESCEGVKLPDGIGKMRSLQHLCTIDLRKCSVSSLKELGKLRHLKYIAVVSSDEPEDTRINTALLSSLDKSTELRYLKYIEVVVYSDFRLSMLQSSTLYNLNCQKKLTVLRRSLKVPTGIAHCFLGMLDVRVCKLEEDDLGILRWLPRLQSLIVRLEFLPTKMIHISCEGFAKLENFYVDCRMPRMNFEEGAMPKLEHLELKLYSGTASEEHMCINHLLNLQKVTLRYSKWYATNKGVRKTTEAVKTECKEHQNEITLCIAEEEKNGICDTQTEEVFQENRVASCSMMTEIEEEEEEDTQEGGLHQSIHDIARCSGTSEIEEVVE